MIETPREPITIVNLGDRAPGGSQLRLLVIAEGLVQEHVLPSSGDVVIGRSSDSDVPVDHPSVSRRHVVLRLHDGAEMTIEDVGSANGTRLREVRLAPGRPERLAVGEMVDMGAAMFVVQKRSQTRCPRRLWSHGYFEARLEEECSRAQRSGGSFAVLRLSLASQTKSSVVEDTMAEVLRDTDIIGCYAPREYECLLVDLGASDLERVVARINERVAQRGEKVDIGRAVYPRDGRDSAALQGRVAQAASGKEAAGASEARLAVEGVGAHLGAAGSAMQGLGRLVERIAASSISVLVLGETGVGKEVVAETIHRQSGRAQRSFLRLNCAALSESLLESELFGHERGAFTGAVAAKPGLLETADGGTVFLDEVGELPPTIQAKLLRVLETRQVLRVGGLKPRTIDVRFVAATNRDLEAEVACGRFRQDLFYRLNGVTLVIPPLRERTDEIEGLAKTFVKDAEAGTGRGAAGSTSISDEVLTLLKSYPWPGNIRELRNVMERAVLLCGDGAIRPEHLPMEKLTVRFGESPQPQPSEPARAAPSFSPLRSMRREVEEIERKRIVEALEKCAGNQTEAARLLGISRRTLINKVETFGLPRPRKLK